MEITNEAVKFAKIISEKFKKSWDKNDYSFSDGKSIEIWIRQTIEDEFDKHNINIEESKTIINRLLIIKAWLNPNDESGVSDAESAISAIDKLLEVLGHDNSK